MERADARLPLRAVRPRLLAELRACARNPSFLAVTGVLLFSWLGLLSVQNNLLLYVRYATDVEDAVTTILVVFQLSAIAFLVGAGAAVAYLIPWSMLPDVVAEDELQTGVRREGTHYGVFVLVQQAGLSLGLAGSNLALEAAGYVNADLAGGVPVQPASVATTLRALVSLVPATFLLLSLPFLAAYPITRARHTATAAALAARHALAALPPVDGPVPDRDAAV